MTGRPTFADFLQAAHHSLDARVGEPSPARGDVDEVSRSLLRVITVLRRYVQDTATAFSDVPRHVPAPSGPWGRARVHSREALANSTVFLLRSGTSRPAWPGVPSASPLARRLDQVASVLTAGRDLLHTHFTPGPSGGRAPESPWAAALTSERVNRALLAEIGALAQPIGHHGANVALAPVPGAPTRAEQRRALNAACQWLWVLAASIEAACQQQPVPAGDRDLLAAIPVNVLPARPALAAATTIADLCDGVIVTADRVRYLAWHSAHQPSWSPALTAASLRQAAETSTLTSHHCALLATTLAQRAAHGPFPIPPSDLAVTAQTARQATRTWYQTARALREVTTETRGHITPAAAESSALARWTGRLAYDDPTWTLTSGPGHPPRSPQNLAPQPHDLPHVIAAVHHATDALAMLADTEHHQLRAAARAGRILVPTRTLTSDYDIPCPYAPAPPERTSPLLARYRDATRASRQASVAIGRAAQATSAPSRILTTARETTSATQPATPVPELENRATDHGQNKAARTPGPLQATLHGLGVTDATLLARGADLDHAGQRLLIDAADALPPAQKRPPATSLNKTAASAALLNHALASDHQAAQLLRQPDQREREQPGLEPEP